MVTEERSTDQKERDHFFARPVGCDRERLRATFDEVAGLYDAARPRYPLALYDDLVELTGIGPKDRLLEVGCATGIATRPLLERGYELVCLEPGLRLAAAARRNLRSHPADVRCTHFETFTGPPDRFGLVFAATAWHSIDPDVRYRHGHALLARGGHLAFWNALHAFPADVDPFFEKIGAVYEEIGWPRAGDWPPPTPDQIADDAGEITASGLFSDIQTRRYVWDISYTAEQYIALLATFSSHIALPPAHREHLYDWIRAEIASRPSHQLRRHWYAILHIARRRDVATDDSKG